MWQTIVGALAILVLTLYFMYDKQKARYIGLQGAFRYLLQKARRDRNTMVRVPAAKVAEMFELDERIIDDPPKLGKLARHPAAQPPNRGKG